MFYIGKTFESINELHEVKKSFEDTYFVELRKKDVRTFSSAKKRAPKGVANINASLQYYSNYLLVNFLENPCKKTDRKKEIKVFAKIFLLKYI